jgi:phenylalanyl-tRNA synthetase alpha chain
MSLHVLSAPQVVRALSIRDLTDPNQGVHAMQLLVAGVLDALSTAWRCEIRLHRQSPIVSIADNYDRLHYPHEGAARDARYTRYVCDTALLRTQTSAMIPPILRALAAETVPEVLIACPGLVYRRDAIDRLHTGEPHQIDLWRIRRTEERLTAADLEEMIGLVTGALLPGREVRTSPAVHPYTIGGLQIDVRDGSSWVEIGECGLALPPLLEECGVGGSGLAMGLGLDRILMLRKGIDDIRLLRSNDPRIMEQMIDLSLYRPVASTPPVRRDLSLVLEEEASEEEIGDVVRAALQDRASEVESVKILSDTPYDGLPPSAIARLGIAKGQRNVLLRVVLRAIDRTLTHEECNELRDRIYAALHRGSRSEWAARHD